MKISIIAIALFILLPQSAAAQNPVIPPRAFGYALFGGGTAGVALNSTFGYEVRAVNGLGAAAEVGGFGLGQKDNNKETGLASFNLTYHYFQKKPPTKLAPYISGGLSEFLGHNTRTNIGSVGPYHTVGFNAGGGIDAFASEHVGVRFDVRYFGHGGRILNWVYPNVQQYSLLEVRVGITFR